MRKLTENEVEMLKGLSADEIMKELENIYKDDKDTLLKIQECESIKGSLQWIETYPAYAKSYEMFIEHLREMMDRIGYYNEALVNLQKE